MASLILPRSLKSQPILVIPLSLLSVIHFSSQSYLPLPPSNTHWLKIPSLFHYLYSHFTGISSIQCTPHSWTHSVAGLSHLSKKNKKPDAEPDLESQAQIWFKWSKNTGFDQGFLLRMWPRDHFCVQRTQGCTLTFFPCLFVVYFHRCFYYGRHKPRVCPKRVYISHRNFQGIRDCIGWVEIFKYQSPRAKIEIFLFASKISWK